MSSVVGAVRDPELSARALPVPPFDPPNHIYDAVEAVLELAGTPRLEGLVRPGARVLVKPNFVTDRYYHERLLDARLLASSTHASVIRPLVDFALERGASLVTVADTPIEGCDLESVTAGMGFQAMIDELRRRGRPVRFLDLRPFRIVPRMPVDDLRLGGRSWNLGILQRRALAGDPHGYRVVDAGAGSWFADVGERDRLLRFHRSHPTTPLPHHTAGRHEYGIPQTVLDADVVIHVPKLKTHKKSGVTLSLKSSIGLCGYKYWLPHYTAGAPPLGDEFPVDPAASDRLAARLSRLPLPRGHSLVARAPRVGAVPQITEGSWEGNDTIWRTTLDLARIHLHADRDGRLQPAPVRGFLAVVDGIVGGEGEGPFGVRPVELGLLLAGTDPVLVDAVGAGAMGYDWRAVRTIARAAERPLLATSQPDHVDARWRGPRPERAFAPPAAWPSLLGGRAAARELAAERESGG
jgi:uncharacterized protein (DUF362 family)